MNTGIGLMILGVMVAVVGVAGFGGYANRGFKLGGLRSSTPEPGGGGESETPPVGEAPERIVCQLGAEAIVAKERRHRRGGRHRPGRRDQVKVAAMMP
jgi:hypothetical protein